MPRVAPCRVCGAPCQLGGGSSLTPKHRGCVEHGTIGAYTHGCRCDACRTAQRNYMRDYSARRRVEGRPIRPPRRLIERECDRCGERFTVRADQPNRFCSLGCANLAQRRSVNVGGRFWISRVVRREIYERDDWTCQICHEPVEPDADPNSDWYPTLDHIVPQSHQLIPDHSPEALRTAHRWCNAVRGDLTYYKDADLTA